MATKPTEMTAPALAQILFASRLQESQGPSDEQIRSVVENGLCACRECAEYVAQEAGDHPELFARRMRWALDAVSHAFPRPVSAA
ncbi:hypothetical protein [Actinomadura rupiterrae]|uniref:hypothetical protein n=1 Tax=Actinomadura rupiterrae TaxID=559627 RepID=UPI0020A2DC19|nr:hypothetical protein [Actinomadura rupiterrae]MCP2340439.1 hypothetical protein [Actinomadura rupiterrae]